MRIKTALVIICSLLISGLQTLYAGGSNDLGSNGDASSGTFQQQPTAQQPAPSQPSPAGPVIRFEGQIDIWRSVSYELLEAGRRQHYTNLTVNEMQKYPDDFFNKIDLDIILIGKNLKFNNVYRAAVPDNYTRVLFLGIRDDYTDDYFKHVFHHELNHYIEFYIWGDYRYDWDQWRRLYNVRGGGGESAYQGGEDSNAIIYNPNLPGFLNHYSTLGQEEDRAEMIAFFLTENGNRIFIEKAKNDDIFYQKSILLFTFYKEILNFNLLDEFLLKVNR